MTISILQLILSVTTLFMFIGCGFMLKKLNFTNDGFAKALSLLVIYLAQIPLYVDGYIAHFDKTVFIGLVLMLVISFAAHALFYVLARFLFRRSPEDIRRVLTFGVVFSNAGYMGLPLISDVLGSQFCIYATVYLVGFNAFAYTVGRLIYTDDKSYVSVKKVFLNPVVIPIIIGIIIYLTGAGGWICDVTAVDEAGKLIRGDFIGNAFSIILNVMRSLKNIVAPASMIIVGVRLAEVNFRSAFRDRYLYYFLGVRLILFPVIVWALLRPFAGFGLISGELLAVTLIVSSTPTAAATSMFAELYNSNGPYAGTLVSVSTLCSILTMPLVALLLFI